MRRNYVPALAAFLLMAGLVLLPGCQSSRQAGDLRSHLTTVLIPSVPGSGEPNLAVINTKTILLSWIGPVDSTANRLNFMKYDGQDWSALQTVASGKNWFVNWADFPSLASPDGKLMAANWLVKSKASPYAYDVFLALSRDGGKQWSRPFKPHRDNTATEHGFVSIIPEDSSHFRVAWLDGRNFAKKQGEENLNVMTLRSARVAADGTVGDTVLLDERVCDCCQTSAAKTENGIFLAYRNRTAQEVRDINYVILKNGRWSPPKTLYADGWEIHGCPVNGPAVAAAGKKIAVAWFTAAHNQPRVKISFSANEGGQFSEPLIVDDGHPLGRVDAVLLEDGSAVVSWMESAGDSAYLKVRKISSAGTPNAARIVAEMDPSRASGFPKMVYAAGKLYIVWREIHPKAHIRLAVLNPRLL